jgi:hypothetical protein
VLQPGELIGPAEIGILATVGVVQVPVHRRPHVAITSTGDEVRGDAQELLPWHCRGGMPAAPPAAGLTCSWACVQQHVPTRLFSSLRRHAASASYSAAGSEMYTACSSPCTAG